MQRSLIRVLLGLFTLLAPCRAEKEGLEAGIARVDLTPPMEMKASLGGYGERMSEPATGVHDRVFAKALVLREGEKRYALVTADILGFPPPFRPALIEKIAEGGWSKEQVLLLPSHSHTSIDMTALNPNNTFGIPQIGPFHKELFDFALDRLAEAIEKAAADTTPIVVGTSSRPLEGWAANRREGGTEKDEVLTVTRIDTKSGSPLAVLVNWSAHPTFMDAPDMMFSGGWPGHMQRTVEALIGEGVTVLYYNGAQGDQRPVGRPDSGDSNWERAERYGRELGILVHDLWSKTETLETGGLSYAHKEMELPERTWHKDFMETGGAEYGMNPETAQVLIEALFPTQTVSSAVRLGNLVIVGVPGEMAAGLGKEVKKRVAEATQAQNVVIGGLANEWISYILSSEEYTKGGYEASVSFYGPQLGPRIVEGAVEVASTLKP
jgi:hypothetical protein